MSALERLGRAVAREQDLLRARSFQRARVRERIVAWSPKPKRSWGAAYALGGAALAAAAVSGWLLSGSPSPAKLAVTVGTAARPVQAGAWIDAPANEAALPVRFSDGSRVELAPGTRARLVEVGASGAHLLIESGQARVDVVPRRNAAFRLSVGPFGVRVLGTSFDVRWRPEQDEFRLELARGRVELAGCVFGAAYELEAGQAVVASCRRGQLEVGRAGRALEAAAPPAPSTGDAAKAPAADAPVATAPASEPLREDRPRAAVKAHARSRHEGAWRPLAEQGRYAEALAAARAAGFEAECARADAADLALLADTARYAGAAAEERTALRLLRRRFAGTSRAALAAFALGRLEFDQHRSHAKAIRWFQTYLREQPRGPLAREARGRLIEATLAAGDARTARVLAAEYLEDHPAGPHAALARSLIDGASP